MTDINQEPTTSTEASPETPERANGSRLLRFGRRHPALTMVGVAGAGLLGGIEMAAGVLLGAGVAALIRRTNGAARETAAERRGRVRQMLERRPHDLHDLKQRARAVMSAVLGEMPTAESAKPAQPSEAVTPA